MQDGNEQARRLAAGLSGRNWPTIWMNLTQEVGGVEGILQTFMIGQLHIGGKEPCQNATSDHNGWREMRIDAVKLVGRVEVIPSTSDKIEVDPVGPNINIIEHGTIAGWSGRNTVKTKCRTNMHHRMMEDEKTYRMMQNDYIDTIARWKMIRL